jgi:transposase
MSSKRYIDKEKETAESANFQPSLFDNSVVEHTAIDKPILSHSTRRRKRKRRRAAMVTIESIDSRRVKGQLLADATYIKERDGYYSVRSAQPNRPPYKIRYDNFNCNCPDFTFNKQKCKHIYCLEEKLGRIVYPDPPARIQPDYSQKWTAYNKSQTSEKAVFLGLLSELTRETQEPENATGRPALNLGDMLFACVFKVYSQMSSRRFTTDLKDAQVKGYINEAPHYNSLCRYMEKTSLTHYLEMLVEETSKPLASLETDFAVDSTGLQTSNSVTWNRAKYQDTVMLKKKNWVKVHCCIGVKTNVITGVEITDKTGHDTSSFLPVLEATRKNFAVKEVSADAAYTSSKHFAYAELHGISAYIDFKDRATGKGSLTNSAWKRMFHYYNLNRTEFIQHYGKRNNVETTFHMLKSKFGSMLKSKTFEAQKNEALCKVICHNISCLIHSMNEFGITPGFLLK